MKLHVRRKPGAPCRGILAAGPLRMECALGRGSTTIFKREGDGAAPVGAHRLLFGHYRADRAAKPDSRLSFTPIRAGMGWCDAEGHASYNRPVRLPFAAGHERMMRDDNLYDIVIVLDWNIRRRRHGAGSAIFFHLAKPGYAPTEGCIAISRRNMARLAPFLSRHSVLVVHR